MERPHKVYKYEPFTLQAVENLKSCTLYFGSPFDFNDPFDCAIDAQLAPMNDDEVQAVRESFLQDPSVPESTKRGVAKITVEALRDQITRGAKNAIDQQRDNFLKTRGVTCFSESHENLLMWSHYGDKYKGFCLEFQTDDEPFSLLRKVEYVEHPPTLNTKDIGLNIGHGEVIDKLFCTKHVDWRYEKEWRIIHANSRQPYTYKPESLTAIYFGPRMTSQHIDLLCLILYAQMPSVRLFKGTRSKTEFKLEFEEQTGYIPYVEAKRRGLA